MTCCAVVRSCILSGDNAYIYWCAYVLPLCVDVCANVVVVTRLLATYCHARCKQRDVDKPTHFDATGHRVSIHISQSSRDVSM